MSTPPATPSKDQGNEPKSYSLHNLLGGRLVAPPTPSRFHVQTLAEDESQSSGDLPITSDELTMGNFVDIPLDQLPKPYKREAPDRVFCNRNLSLTKIKFYGFDMDYTLAEYFSPAIDMLAYDAIAQRLISLGYPEILGTFQFDEHFAVRGLFFDKHFGNLIKLDGFGNILIGFHGRKKLSLDELTNYYPNLFVVPTDERFYIMNTLFNIPETCMFADVIQYFNDSPEYSLTDDKRGVLGLNHVLSFQTIFNDIRSTVDWVHNQGDLKANIVANLPKYVRKEPRLPLLFDRMRENGARVFLVTNSDYKYSDKIMSYLFDVPQSQGRSWRSFFDLIVVSANKPLFFEEGTALREVDLTTGKLKLGEFIGHSFQGKVFSGGAWSLFDAKLNASGQEILYIGDHIFGDVLKTKKVRGWRTFLVIPELTRELSVSNENKKFYEHIKNLEFILSEVCRGMDSESKPIESVSLIKAEIEATSLKLGLAFNANFGSLFRTGTQQSYYAMQTQKYADLYAPSFINLINYPLFYEYRAMDHSLPHETFK